MERIMTTTRKSNKRNTAAKRNTAVAQTETVTFYPPVVVGNVSCDACYYPPVEYTIVSHDDTIVDAEWWGTDVIIVPNSNTGNSNTDNSYKFADVAIPNSYNWAFYKNGTSRMFPVSIVPELVRCINKTKNVPLDTFVSYRTIADTLVRKSGIICVNHKRDLTIDTFEIYAQTDIDNFYSNPNLVTKAVLATTQRLISNYADNKDKNHLILGVTTDSYGMSVSDSYKCDFNLMNAVLERFSKKLPKFVSSGKYAKIETKESVKNAFKSKTAKTETSAKTETKKTAPKAEPKKTAPKDTSETDSLKAALDALKAELDALKAKQPKVKTVLRKKQA